MTLPRALSTTPQYCVSLRRLVPGKELTRRGNRSVFVLRPWEEGTQTRTRGACEVPKNASL